MSLATSAAITFIGTPDHRRALAWYRDTLGLKLVDVDNFAAVFDLAGTMLRLTTIPDWKAHPHTVLGWITADIHAELHRLTAQGVRFEIYPGFGQDADGIWSAPGGGPKVAWFLDPDGNNLSLTQL